MPAACLLPPTLPASLPLPDTLCAPAAQVYLYVGSSLDIVDALHAGGGGARIVELASSEGDDDDAWLGGIASSLQLQQVPAQLAPLAQLKALWLLFGQPVRGGWEHLPTSLRQLALGGCGLELVPAELSQLTQLTHLSLFGNPVQGGWPCLPKGLRRLYLGHCGLQLVPELSQLSQLEELVLDNNPSREKTASGPAFPLSCSS